MFRKELKEKFEKIFGLAKTTFDAPSDAFEQDVLFIEVDECFTKATKGSAIAKITGTLTTFSKQNAMTYGFMNKRVAQAAAELTKDLFLFDVEQDIATSPARLQNISERRTKFLYLYSGQYDPNQGELTSLEVGEITDVEFEGEE